MKVIANGVEHPCSRAVKGSDYIVVYDANGNKPAHFSGISDFSGYLYVDDYGNPAEFEEPVPTAEETIASLKAQNDQLTNVLSQMSTDFAGFMDYYFAMHPDEA